MYNLYDKVIIKSKNISGTIIDIVKKNNGNVITVESDVKGKRNDGYGGDYPIFDCMEDDLQMNY